MVRLPLFCVTLLMLFASCAEQDQLDLRGPILARNGVPETLLNCADSPSVPAADSQRQVAGYIVALHGAHRDCKANLDAVGGILRGQDAQAKASQENEGR